MEADAVDMFVQLLVEARDAGVVSLRDKWIADGWRPKTPTPRHEHVAQLIGSLTAEDREALVEAVKYFTDLSFFRLLGFLEEGARGLEFELTMISAAAPFSLINRNEDLGLRARFLLGAGE